VPDRASPARYRAGEQAEIDWDRKAGLSELRGTFDRIRDQYRTAQQILGSARLGSVEETIAVISVLNERAMRFEELSEERGARSIPERRQFPREASIEAPAPIAQEAQPPAAGGARPPAEAMKNEARRCNLAGLSSY
jgi:hypothetical protein